MYTMSVKMSASFHKNLGNWTSVVRILAFDCNSNTHEHRMGDKGILAAVKERCWKAVRYSLSEYITAWFRHFVAVA